MFCWQRFWRNGNVITKTNKMVGFGRAAWGRFSPKINCKQIRFDRWLRIYGNFGSHTDLYRSIHVSKYRKWVYFERTDNGIMEVDYGDGKKYAGLYQICLLLNLGFSPNETAQRIWPSVQHENKLNQIRIAFNRKWRSVLFFLDICSHGKNRIAIILQFTLMWLNETKIKAISSICQFENEYSDS